MNLSSENIVSPKDKISEILSEIKNGHLMFYGYNPRSVLQEVNINGKHYLLDNETFASLHAKIIELINGEDK